MSYFDRQLPVLRRNNNINDLVSSTTITANTFYKRIFFYFFLVVTCIPDVVADSTKSPELAEHDYNTAVTYTCNTGYELTSGDLTRTCHADGSWTGTTPVCSSKPIFIGLFSIVFN